MPGRRIRRLIFPPNSAGPSDLVRSEPFAVNIPTSSSAGRPPLRRQPALPADRPARERTLRPPPRPLPRPDPALPELPGITLASEPLNRGPFAAVYRGWDRVHRCDVIVKVQRATGDPVAAERFRREAAVMKRLSHPNIVAPYQFHDGDPAALVLEYVPGQTLADQVDSSGWLTPLRAAQVIEDIAAALDCAHAQGIIHRDVKPSNILLPRRGPARLYDFGVAHIDEDVPLTVMGDILGTIEYASPEQVHGNEVPDARSDVYSLAAVAYFALAKTPPFRAADNSAQAQLSVMHRQVFADPPSLRLYRKDIAPVVEAAVLRGLAKAPASRYPSAGQFAAALRAAVEAGTGAPEQRATLAASRRTGGLAGALAGAALLFLAVLALWRTGQFTSPHPARAAQVTKPPTQTPPKAAVPAPGAPQPVAVAAPPSPSPHPAPRVPVAAVRPTSKPIAAIKPVPEAVVATRPRPQPVKRLSRSKPRRFKPTRHLLAAVVHASHPEPSPMLSPPLLPAPAGGPETAAETTPKQTTPQRAWLSVFAKQYLAQTGSEERVASINPQSVWVDGYRASHLAEGRWASLPAGRHVVSFIPDPKSGFAPRQHVVVMLTPGAHVRKQILLPIMIGAAAPAAALPSAGQPPSPFSITAAASTVRPVGWYTVSGWVRVNTSGRQSPPKRASARWVKVDGQPVPALALGRWAQLPAGPHVVSFQPAPALGLGPKTWNIDLVPQAHLNQHIPLPAVSAPTAQLASQPLGRLLVSGWLPVTLPGQKPQLVPVAAEWIKIDGQPSPGLAQGRWVSLPAGRHVLVFQPMPGSGANPSTRLIFLAPQTRLNQPILLPAVPLPATLLHLRDP